MRAILNGIGKADSARVHKGSEVKKIKLRLTNPGYQRFYTNNPEIRKALIGRFEKPFRCKPANGNIKQGTVLTGLATATYM